MYGFRSETEFKSWLAEYRYKSADQSHNVDILIEDHVGDLYGRLQQKMVLSPQGRSAETSLQGAWFADPKTALIAGRRYREDQGGGKTWLPEAGVQVGDVPVVVSYDTRNKSVSIGPTLKFGR